MTDTDPIAQIRAALDAGPTPGPWHVDQDRRPGMAWNRHIYHGADLAICFMAHSNGKDPRGDEANARLIAACNPAAIRELLAERDALLEALQHMQHCASCAEDYWQNCEGGRAALAAIDAAKGKE